MNTSAQSKGNLALGLVMLLVAVSAFAAYQNTRRFLESGDRVTHTFEVLDGLENVRAAVVDAEAEQRGYLISGDPRYLEQFHETVASLPASLERLDELTHDNPNQQARIERLEPLVYERIARLEHGLDLYDTGGFAAAQAFINTGAGLDTMTEVRALIAEMVAEENVLLRRRTAEEESSTNNTTATFGFLTVLTAAALVFCAFIIRRDIASRQRAQAALQTYSDELQDLYDNAPCGYHSLDATGVFVRINQTELDWLGYTASEVIGKMKFSDLLTDASLEVFHANFLLIKERGWVNDLEYELKRKDGSTFLVLLSATILRDAEGNYLSSRATLWDITERKRIEAKLHESEKRFSVAFQASPAAISISTLPDGRWMEINEALTKMTGYTSEEMLNHTSLELGLIDTTSRAKILEAIRTQGFVRDVEIQICTKTNDIVDVLVSIEQIELHGQACALTILYDITKLKQAEREVRRLNDDLERRADALEAANKELESFSYTISHDLRAPLRAIDGFARILVDEHAANLPAAGQRYVQRMRTNAQKMGMLIDDLLAFSRLSRQALQKRPVSMTEIVQTALEQLRNEREGRTIDITIADLPPSQGDPALLLQVYVNLISNSIKYTSKRDDARIEVGSRQENGETVYFVADNGAGFDMQYSDKLFGVFNRLHRDEEYKGTGVGLAIVARIVQRHGGRVWADAQVDQGATFFFTLNGAESETETETELRAG